MIPFLETPAGLFWLACTIEFVFQEGNFSIDQVSVLLFQGEASDVDKKPILRAEWDPSHVNSRSAHAQPHWHVYSSSLHQDIDEYPAFTPEAEVIEFGQMDIPTPNIWSESAKFHFAMAAKWHLEDVNAHRELLDTEEKLLGWLTGCISYIRHQLSYIYQ